MGILFLLIALCATHLRADEVSFPVEKSDFSFDLADKQPLFITIAYGSWTRKLTIDFMTYDSSKKSIWSIGNSQQLLARRIFAFDPDKKIVITGDVVHQLAPLEALLKNNIMTKEEWATFCIEWIASLKGIIRTILHINEAAPAIPIQPSLLFFITSAERVQAALFLDRFLYDIAQAFTGVVRAY